MSEQSHSMFTYNESNVVGGAANLITRDDAEYFLMSTYGINLDELEQKALLSRLPVGTCLVSQDMEINHPYINWEGTKDSAMYIYRPTDYKLASAAKTGHDIVAIVAKDQIKTAIELLADYAITMFESVGELALLWAKDNDPRKVRTFGGNKTHPPNWSLLVNSTDGWDAEKIIEDGYVHLLGCNDTSPYLTQLETNLADAREI